MNSQAAVTTAKPFNTFSDGINKFAHNLFSGCSRIDVVFDSNFDNSLISHALEACGCRQFFHLQKQPICQRTSKLVS